MKTEEFDVKNSELIEYKKKTMARKFVSTWIKSGKLIRAESCQLCNMECKTEAHHTDYGRPVAVMWLCDSCHGLVHRDGHEFNPKECPQTPVYLAWEESESVTVSFTLPARNFIALKKYSKQQNTTLSKILRNCIVKTYPVTINQLNFNFELENELYTAL